MTRAVFELVLWGAVTFFCALGWATWMEKIGGPACTCAKGRRCPACLAASQEIRGGGS